MISAQLLTERYQQAFRDVFVTRYPFVVHAGRAECLDSFVERGLVPAALACALDVDEDELRAVLGGSIPDIVCLTTPMQPVSGTHDGPLVQFAVQTRDLPGALSLDWSMGGTWPLPDILFDQASCATWDEAFLETFQRRRSIVVMQCVHAEFLRVRTLTSDAYDPACWPKLLATAPEDIYRGAV
jgi:hypothetical protein